MVLTVQVRTQEDVQAVEPEPAVSNVQYQHADYEQALASADGDGDDAAVAVAVAPPFVRAGREGRPQRSVPVRVGQEIQALPRRWLRAARDSQLRARAVAVLSSIRARCRSRRIRSATFR